MDVIINKNTETGELKYAVCRADDPEDWLDSFGGLEEAAIFALENGHRIVKIMGCR